MIGVHAVIFRGNEIIGIGSDVTIAAVAIVEVPVTAAGLFAGIGVDGDLIGVNDKDAAVEVELVVGVFPQSIVVAYVSAFHVVIDGLRRLKVDRLGVVGTAVNAVVEDTGGQLAVTGNVRIENAVIIIVDSHSVARPSSGGSGSVPPIHACIVLAVLSEVEVVVPGQGMIALTDNEFIIFFLDFIARLGIENCRMMDINVLGRNRAVFAVRHLEINFCYGIYVGSRLFGIDRSFVNYVVRVERDGRQREYQHKSQ